MKQYIGFSNDHSRSMSGLTEAALRDFNTNISAIKSASLTNSLDTIVNVVQCGIRTGGYGSTGNVRQIVNSNVTALKPLTSYVANGNSTPLFDSVGELIEMLKAVPDANDQDVSFLILVTTDGGENSSRKWSGVSLADEIRKLQATDRWTFVFRVPRGGKLGLTRMGIPEGNIQEWDQTTRGVDVSTQATTAAFNDYYENRGKGLKSTSTFYSNLANVSAAEVKASLKDISAEVSMFYVASHQDDMEIRPFVEAQLKSAMLKGAAFYQLSKTESKIQDTKMIVIRDKKTGSVYYGPAARQLIGLPTTGNARVHPGNHGNFDIFVQSTSVNRKVKAGTQVMYWSRVGQAFTEGPSYQPKAAAVQAQIAVPVAPIVAAVQAPTKAAPAKTSSTGRDPNTGRFLPKQNKVVAKIRLVRKKDHVFVMEVDTMAEAQAAIAKAKSAKKATLVIA